MVLQKETEFKLEKMTEGVKNKAKRKDLPTWSRLVIILVLIAFWGSISGIIYGVYSFQQTFQNAENPKYIAKVASDVATFPEPLPKDYKYIFGVGMDFLHAVAVKIVAIDYKKGKQQLVFISVNQKQKVGSVLEDAYRIGINTPKYSGKFTKIIRQGSFTIQGRTMPYIIGNVTDTVGKKHIGLVSCVVAPKKQKTIIFYSIQPNEKEKFDINVVVKLLTQITSF